VRMLAALATPLIVVALVACGDDEGEDTTVDVTIGEWFINLSVDVVPPGDVTFDFDNEGPDYDHGLVIIQTDLAPGELPTNDDGTVDLGGPGVTRIGSTVVVEADDDASGVFSLDDEGNYVVISNEKRNVDGVDTADYEQGMFAGLTVQKSATPAE
jgi:hypothetical protein